MTKETVLAVFDNFKIRRVFDEKSQTWLFSVIDIIAVLIEQNDYQTARKYWNKLKGRLNKEGNESVTNCHQLKLKAADGKKCLTDVANPETLLRLIQSVPSPKAEPIKLWLAKVGYERIQDMGDPTRSLDRARKSGDSIPIKFSKSSDRNWYAVTGFMDEFEKEKSWWKDETNGFVDRIENEFAWKVDFKSRRLEARAKAQPHQDKADSLKIEANDSKRQAKFLSDFLSARKQEKTFVEEVKEHATDLKNTTITNYTQNLIEILDGAAEKTKPSAVIKYLEKAVETLKETSQKLANTAKDEQAAHDRIYWPIYNLDEKNPNAPEAKKHDPDELLKQYKELAKEIAQTEEQLKQELAKAFAHHFTEGEV